MPPKTIDDPTDSKPSDWVDEKMIDDPEDFKPEDWDESQPAEIEDFTAVKPEEWDESAPKLIPDPDATKPEDWNDEEDGSWEAPVIENPACTSGCGPWSPPKVRNPLFRGKWHPRRIANPAYKGEWKARQIDNPEYFEETNPYAKLDSIAAIGLELWTITSGITFSNFIVTNDEAEANELAVKYWLPKKEAEAAASGSGLFELVKTFFTQVKAAADQSPYLYIVFTAAIGLPIIFFIRCLTAPDVPPARAAAANAGIVPAAEGPSDTPVPDTTPEMETVEPNTEAEPSSETAGNASESTESSAPSADEPSVSEANSQTAAEPVAEEVKASVTEEKPKQEPIVQASSAPAEQDDDSSAPAAVSQATTPVRKSTRKLKATL